MSRRLPFTRRALQPALANISISARRALRSFPMLIEPVERSADSARICCQTGLSIKRRGPSCCFGLRTWTCYNNEDDHLPSWTVLLHRGGIGHSYRHTFVSILCTVYSFCLSHSHCYAQHGKYCVSSLASGVFGS